MNQILRRQTCDRSDTYIKTLNTKLTEQLEKLVSTKSTKLCIGANENVVQIPETEHTTNEETLVKTIDDTTSTNSCRQSHHGHREDRMSTNKGKQKIDNNKQINLDSIKNLERNTELKQKELHLKKWEEELKLKKLYRNHELFRHIQTLQTRIEQVELHLTHTNHQTNEQKTQQHDHKETNINNSPNNGSEIMKATHNRVTNFVLKQINIQLQHLENNMDGPNNNGTPSVNKSTTETTSQTDFSFEVKHVQNIQQERQNLPTSGSRNPDDQHTRNASSSYATQTPPRRTNSTPDSAH